MVRNFEIWSEILKIWPGIFKIWSVIIIGMGSGIFGIR